MNESASGSLQNLHDVVAPVAIGWWPLAPGGYLILGLSAVGLAWLAYRRMLRFHHDRYRRVALRTLRQIQERGPGPQAAAELAVLLKKTALAAWPRTRVASLSGHDWSNFLVHTGASKTAAQRLSAAAYSDLTSDPTSDPAAHDRLCEEAAKWIRGHQVKAQE